ncbi:jg18196 [Pararge aegeria aegeria]|uniref:Jg18196 protein n=2 Tax=Pararge aegeria TaxID=116150 RepID=A0A8S4RBH4_9NEOP|nr:jg18196 [Pararge aegeria aegeria]
MMNIVYNEKHNKHYRKKYHFMKLKVKSLIIENAALCDEIAKIQENIQIVKDERKFLLRKLLEYENDSDIVQTFYSNEQVNGTRSKPKKQRSMEDGGKIITM